jgi:hypothetical protein
MATSGVYSITTTLTDLVRHAMLNIGKLGEAETPSSQEFTDVTYKMNALIKQWQGKTDFAPGLKMWTRRVGALMLGAAVNNYVLGPTVAPNSHWTLVQNLIDTNTSASAITGATTLTLQTITQTNSGVTTTIVNGFNVGILTALADLFWTTVTNVAGNVITLAASLPAGVANAAQVFAYQANAQNPLAVDAWCLRDQAGADVPGRFMNVQDYAMQPSKAQSQFISDPYFAYFEYQIAGSNWFFEVYGASDVSKYAVIWFREPVQTLVNTTDSPEFPDEWIRPIEWGTSKEIAPMFNVPWTQDMEGNLQESLAFARQKDAETTTMYFQPGVE